MVATPASDLFFDAGGLAGQVAQVVQLGATHIAATLHRDVGNAGAVQLEYALYAFAVRDLAHRHRGVVTPVAARDHHALVGLHAFPVAFGDLHVHHDGVAGLEFRHLACGALGFNLLDDVVHGSICLSCKYSFNNSTSSAELARRVRNRSGLR